MELQNVICTASGRNLNLNYLLPWGHFSSKCQCSVVSLKTLVVPHYGKYPSDKMGIKISFQYLCLINPESTVLQSHTSQFCHARYCSQITQNTHLPFLPHFTFKQRKKTGMLNYWNNSSPCFDCCPLEFSLNTRNYKRIWHFSNVIWRLKSAYLYIFSWSQAEGTPHCTVF